MKQFYSNNRIYRGNGSISLYQVSPQITDPKIDNWLEPHYIAVDESRSIHQKLFVFFSGSYGKPQRQKLILIEAAIAGYLAINLRYPNTWTVAGLCQYSRDLNCHEKIRSEIIDGDRRSHQIEIGRSNSIENRLVKLLLYLDRHHPQQNWLDYLTGDSPKWESIVVAGHSQGGGQAAILGKKYNVARVIMLAAPGDYNQELNAPAAWLSAPMVTPPERYYGLVHLRDRGLERILTAWEALGMAVCGPVINIESQLPPYESSSRLLSDRVPARHDKYHGSVATDPTTPKLHDGSPAYRSVWRYLFGCDN